ncbi:hypothetical protein, partial [Pseudidiomarina aestuarii]|uniref:hypothetical protein n=1 Tax=Pseudidiomarina aestuarii TaxID=624146 RepID=UPI001B8B1E72
LSTFPISQVVHLRTFVVSEDTFLCLNPVSAHTVCLAWYIVKEHTAFLKSRLALQQARRRILQPKQFLSTLTG